MSNKEKEKEILITEKQANDRAKGMHEEAIKTIDVLNKLYDKRLKKLGFDPGRLAKESSARKGTYSNGDRPTSG